MEWKKKEKKFLLLVTLHDADSNPDIKAQLDASYVFGRGARVYLALLFYLPLAQIVVFQALAGDASVMAMFLGECTCSSNPSSPVPSVVLTLYANATGHITLA